mmetsp:Transcript_28519/g.66667  ORF Transcript_28519/g.66667 Transcript_28519/m.66667 type:complete len:319 (-) Transcript_28519:490-1446(-)
MEAPLLHRGGLPRLLRAVRVGVARRRRVLPPRMRPRRGAGGVPAGALCVCGAHPRAQRAAPRGGGAVAALQHDRGWGGGPVVQVAQLHGPGGRAGFGTERWPDSSQQRQGYQHPRRSRAPQRHVGWRQHVHGDAAGRLSRGGVDAAAGAGGDRVQGVLQGCVQDKRGRAVHPRDTLLPTSRRQGRAHRGRRPHRHLAPPLHGGGERRGGRYRAVHRPGLSCSGQTFDIEGAIRLSSRAGAKCGDSAGSRDTESSGGWGHGRAGGEDDRGVGAEVAAEQGFLAGRIPRLHGSFGHSQPHQRGAPGRARHPVRAVQGDEV